MNELILKDARSDNTINEAEWLLTCVASDGVITETPGDSNVRPYMANYAAMGLARTYEVTGNPKYLAPIWNWLAWYRDHMDPTTGYVNDYNLSVIGPPSSPAINLASGEATSVQASTNDVVVEFDYTATTGFTQVWGVLQFRCPDAGTDTGYRYQFSANSVASEYLTRQINGAQTVLDTGVFYGSGHYKVSVIGSELTVEFNGSAVKSATVIDSTVDAANANWIHIAAPAGTSINNFVVHPALPQALLFDDEFNRADGALTSPWTSAGAFSISSNAVHSYATIDGDYARLDVGHSDVRVQAKFTAVPPSMAPNASAMGVLVRGSADNSSHYLAHLASGGIPALYKRVSGTYTSLWDGQSSGIVFTAGDVLELSVSGSLLEVKKNGVIIHSVVDVSITAGTYAGLRSGGSDNELWVAAVDYFRVYDSTVNADTSGDSPGGPESTPPDSTDAYAGTYLVALYLAYYVDPAGASKLLAFHTSIPLALTAVESTQQSDGLTYALPVYDVKYLEDNIETLAGVRAAELLASGLGDTTLQSRAKATGDAMAKGVGYMWNHDANAWDYAIHSNHVFAHNNWADENSQRQQVWATAWGAISHEIEGRNLLAEYAKVLPDWSTKNDSFEPIPVWGYRRVQDHATANAAAVNIQANADSVARRYPWTCQVSGIAILGLLGISEAMPDPAVVFPKGINLIPDPKFLIDSNSDGRVDAIVGTYGAPTTSLHPLFTGGNYQTINTPDGNGWAVNWDYIPVVAGTYVTFSLWHRVTRLGSGGGINIKYELYDASHNLITYGYDSKSGLSGPEFSRWYINAWLPPGTAYIRPIIEIGSASIDVAYPQVEVSGSPTAPPYGVPVPA